MLIFDAVKENKPFIINVYRCMDQEQIEKYLLPLTDGLLMAVIEERAEGLTVRDEDKVFIARIYSFVFVGVMIGLEETDLVFITNGCCTDTSCYGDQ